MTDKDKAISPLRQRMIEDMEIRGFTACTQRGYIRAVRDFTVFFGGSPDQASAEDLRRYQHHMRTSGASATTMNAASSPVSRPNSKRPRMRTYDPKCELRIFWFGSDWICQLSLSWSRNHPKPDVAQPVTD